MKNPNAYFPSQMTRRTFVRTSAVAAALAALPRRVRAGTSANEKLNIAAVGIGGQGAADLGMHAANNIVALCDVDANNAGGVFRQFPNAVKYKDFREMLDKEKSIDACTVSTPDHIHAVAALAWM